MTFSVQHNPYLPVYPNVPYTPTDTALAQKVLTLRQSLNSRLQSANGLELINSLLATCANNKLPRQDTPNQQKLPFPPLSPLFSSPGWFHQALASSLQAGTLPSIPRQLPEDLSMPMLSPRSSEAVPPPRMMRPMSSSAGFKRKPSSCQPHEFSSRSDKECIDSLLHCQPTFYPLLRDQVEKAHRSWRTSDPTSSLVTARPQSIFHETGTLVPSLIDGEVIMGFNVWGEKRLCLPHLFRFVLNDVDLKAIDEACTKLQITCTTCSPAQLTLLHTRKILPQAVSSCGLIRKSDAERLTKFIRNHTESMARANFSRKSRRPSRIEGDTESREHCEVKDLSRSRTTSASSIHGDEASVIKPDEIKPDPTMHKNGCQSGSEPLDSPIASTSGLNPTASFSSSPAVTSSPSSSLSTTSSSSSSASSSPTFNLIPVIHECFGRQLGLIHIEMYTEATAKCIECRTCRRLFAPDQFVGHTHTVTEVDNLNHWGFDSSNWRCYLRLHSGRSDSPSSRERVGVARRLGGGTLDERGLAITEEEEEEDEEEEEILVIRGEQSTMAHRKLEEFKIKFAQPIRLPPSLSAALRTVGLFASVAPIAPTTVSTESCDVNRKPSIVHTSPSLPPPSSVPPLALKDSAIGTVQVANVVVTNPSPCPTISGAALPTSSTNATATTTTTTPQPSAVTPTSTANSLPNVSMLPQLTLRRLWAPNDGRIKLPPPPNSVATRDVEVIPKKLHTGPPLLLHAHRVVTQDAADQYDLDYIPNVCLMPPLKPKVGSIISRFRRNSQSELMIKRGRRVRQLSSGSRSRPNRRGGRTSRSPNNNNNHSSSSRTRSISVSSTTSSSYSYDRAEKRHCNGLSVTIDDDSEHQEQSLPQQKAHRRHRSQRRGRRSVCSVSSCSCPSGSSLSPSGSVISDQSIHVKDEGHTRRRKSHCRRRRAISLQLDSSPSSLSDMSESGFSDSVLRVYNEQLSDVTKRRCHSLNVHPLHRRWSHHTRASSRRTTEMTSTHTTWKQGKGMTSNHSYPSHGALSPPSSALHRIRKHRSPVYESHHRQCQDRALAAAKAAQGAASRTCPGLWSRHFANLNGSNFNGSLELPNARKPMTPPSVDLPSPNAQLHLNQQLPSPQLPRFHQQQQHHHTQQHRPPRQQQPGAAPNERSTVYQSRQSYVSNTPVLVTSPTKNSLPTAVLALEAIWADLVRHIDEYTLAVESRSGAGDARQRLFEQFITMQTCYATHIAALMGENQKLNEKLTAIQKQQPATPPTVHRNSNQPTFGRHWNEQTIPSSVADYSSPTLISQQSPISVSEPKTSQSGSTNIYPHRSRKDPSRSTPDQRFSRIHITSPDRQSFSGGCTDNKRSLDPPEIHQHHKQQQGSKNTLSVTTKTTSETSSRSVTPRSTEDMMQAAERFRQTDYDEEELMYLSGRQRGGGMANNGSDPPPPPPVRSSSSPASRPQASPLSAFGWINPSDSARIQPEPDLESYEQELNKPAATTSSSSPPPPPPSSEQMSFKRRVLLPPGDGRPRQLWKPHSRLFSRS